MRKFILRRVVQIVVVLFVILTVLFVLFRLAPGDPVSRMVDPNLTPEDAAFLVSQLGLDQPLGTQYLIYLKNFFAGNLGYSFHYGVPVVEIIADKLPNTILLFTTSLIIAALVGLSWGKIAAWHKGKATDHLLTIAALVTHTLFLPWLALLIIWLFGYYLDWFPINGLITPEVWLDPSRGPWPRWATWPITWCCRCSPSSSCTSAAIFW